MSQAPHDTMDAFVRARLTRIVSGVSVPAPGGLVGPPASDSSVGEDLLATFDAMAGSRALDICARRLREQGLGYYTIGSAGHESNAFVAAALRPTDPALLHYRSGGFFLRRALQAGRGLDDGLRAVLLGLVAAVDDPASGGRHKVFGDAGLSVIPQTSTIASHLPRAVGVAFALSRAKRLRLPTSWPTDSVTVCSFGDASLNHSTAVGALNAAGYCVAQGLPLSLLFVCEDNGLGISVASPADWVGQAAQRPGLRYVYVNGEDPEALSAVTREVVDSVRREQRPALLHLRTVRYLAHAGTDVESGYRTPAEIAADRERDPLLALAAWVWARTGVDPAARYDRILALTAQLSDEVTARPKLVSATAVIAPIAPRSAATIALIAPDRATSERRAEVFGGKLPEDAGAMTLAQCINAALIDAMAARPEVVVFGEDVGRKGGVYGLTRGLARRFTSARAFDTLLDEQTILGLGLGFGLCGLLPIPEIQYLAYLHNAEDQLRGEAASLRFFSNGAYTNPMVVRIAGLAYQKGFGGHFHNDNAVAVLRDIPGLVVACPSRPEDAAPMLRSCLAAGVADGQVSVFLEPIALYHERDLHEPGDSGWLGPYSADRHVPIGLARTHLDGADLTIVTFGNGVRMSLRVAKRLAMRGIQARVMDLRWLAPLPVEDLLREASATGRVLIADETRHAGGVGEGVIAALVENGFAGRIARATSADSYVPLGDAAKLVLLDEDEIERAACDLIGSAERSHHLRSP